MSNTDKMPMWRKVLIAICSLIFIACLILLGNIDSIVHYDYNYVGEWDYHNKSHIGNIDNRDSRGYKLNDNWVNIGNRYWYSNDIEDVNSNKEFGDLIRWYSYKINDSSNPHYGETASLWIYDISDRMIDLDMSKGEFYRYIHDNCANDTTSIWQSTDEFKPFLALYTKPRAVFSIGDDVKAPVYKENFIIFANYRIYCFNFSNDKFNRKGLEGFNYFHRRCKNVIDDTDFISYTQWEKDYIEYKDLKEKQDKERELLGCILYGIVFISLICILVLNIKTIGKVNNQARSLVFYVFACMAIGLISMVIGSFDSPCKDDTLAWLIMVFLPSFVIYMFMITFLSKRSKEAYNTYYLIPDAAIKCLNINTEYTKRLALLFIFYPLFFIVPIPVLGLLVFVYYIVPIVALILIRIGIKRIYSWIKEGKNCGTTPIVSHEDKARLYCRHCGKLIDADSEYCRYCGKKL